MTALVTAPARPTWDDYFLGIARAVAGRADCTRRRVGAVVVWENHVVSTGYNGAPPGEAGCLTAGACPRGQLSYEQVAPHADYKAGPGRCIAKHAEENALTFLDDHPYWGTTLYLTDEPCPDCRKVIDTYSVARVVWPAGEYAPHQWFKPPHLRTSAA